jgi:pyruvate,water dikinase
MELILEGIIGNMGKTEGIAKVIEKESDLDEFKEGQILVSKHTTPLYVIAFGKAKAIVTDIGGLTAHAAILARELGIPCVVGTEKATQVIKTGDKVLVDANEGKIYRL